MRVWVAALGALIVQRNLIISVGVMFSACKVTKNFLDHRSDFATFPGVIASKSAKNFTFAYRFSQDWHNVNLTLQAYHAQKAVRNIISCQRY